MSDKQKQKLRDYAEYTKIMQQKGQIIKLLIMIMIFIASQ